MDYNRELQSVMDRHIEEIKSDKILSSDYLIGLIQMKCIVNNYLRDKEIVLKSQNKGVTYYD